MATGPQIILNGGDPLVIMGSRTRLAAVVPRQRAISTDVSLTAFHGFPLQQNALSVPGSFVVQNIHKTAQQVQTSLSDVFRQAVWQMSSTLKKRKAKMNKHKLRKRRKLERRKSK